MLRTRINKMYWGTEPDGQCTGNGWPPYKWTYDGATVAEDEELARAEGCVPAHTHSGNTAFRCPQKPVVLDPTVW